MCVYSKSPIDAEAAHEILSMHNGIKLLLMYIILDQAEKIKAFSLIVRLFPGLIINFFISIYLQEINESEQFYQFNIGVGFLTESSI